MTGSYKPGDINPATLKPFKDEDNLTTEELSAMTDDLDARLLYQGPSNQGWHDTPIVSGHYAVRHKGFKEPHNLAKVVMTTDGFTVHISEVRSLQKPSCFEFYRIEI